MNIISKSATLVSGSGEFQIGAPNVSPPQGVTLSGAGNNYIRNCNGHKSLIKLGGGQNTVSDSNKAVNSTIISSRGNDTIDIWSNAATIKIGRGSSLVKICKDTKLLIDVSAGKNYEIKYFNGASADVTLTDGAGNYSVRGTAGENIFDYTIADSNLVITAYGGEDLIRVRQPLGAAKISGDDVIIPVGRRGSITVKNGRAHTLNLNGHATIVGGYEHGRSPQYVIKKFMAALDRTKLRGIAAVDEAVRKSSKFSNVNEVIDRMIDDCKRIGDADAFLRDKCSIIFDNADTGAITGWDAGASSVKTNESIVDERGSAKIFRGSNFTVNGLKVNVPSNLRGVQQNIINGLYTWWVKNTLDLIEESYGVAYRFDAPGASVREIDVEFVNNDVSSVASVSHTYSTSSGRASALKLQINMKYYDEINPHDANGSTAYSRNNRRASFLDRTLAHEFTHAIMAANIDFFSDLPAWLKEGTAELTHGISDERRGDLETLAKNPELLRKALDPTADASRVQIRGVLSPVYAAGFIFLHYFAKKVSLDD